MAVMTPTSGSAIAASSAICPAPRIPISSTSTSVSSGARRTSSGSPISVLKLARDACTRRWGASIARSRSFVEVLPTDPVMPITCAPMRRRCARASACRDTSGEWDVRTAPSPGGTVAGRDQDAPGAGGQRGGRVLAPVGVLARRAR